MLKVFGSPGRYVQGPGALDSIGDHAARYGTRAVLVADSLVARMIGQRVIDLCAAVGIGTHLIEMSGDITRACIAKLVSQARPHEPNLVLAAGGGKSLDAGKAVAHALGAALITVPTVASNDAPTSKNYVIYDDNHQLIAVEHLPRSPAAVIVDTLLLAAAPKDLLQAGIGDALSKKFEAEQCAAAGGPNMFGAAPTLAARLLADGAFQVLRADAEDALDCAGSGIPTPAFERTVEAALLLGGLGFESGGLSIAHALTRGWACVPGMAQQRHGLLVAFGLLIQLALEERTDNMLQTLIDWYPRLGLPRTLADLGGADAPVATLREAARKTLAAPHARNFKRTIAVEELVSCLSAFRERAEVF